MDDITFVTHAPLTPLRTNSNFENFGHSEDHVDHLDEYSRTSFFHPTETSMIHEDGLDPHNDLLLSTSSQLENLPFFLGEGDHHVLDEPYSCLLGSVTKIEPRMQDLLFNVISKLASLSKDMDVPALLNHLRQHSISQDPSEWEIETWLNGQYHNNLYVLTPHEPKFHLFEDDIISDDFLASHPSWHQLSAFHRYYLFFCVHHLVISEQEYDDPDFPPWCFQFLVLCLLYGQGWLQDHAHELLTYLQNHVSKWFDRACFCGGLVREAICNTAINNNQPLSDHHRLRRVLPILTSIVCFEGTWENLRDSSLPSDGVAFFEQYENITTFLNNTISLDSIDEWQKLRNDVSQYTPEYFQKLKMRRAIFDSVLKVTDDMVTLKYKGCPKPAVHKRSSINNPEILKQIQHHVSNKKITS